MSEDQGTILIIEDDPRMQKVLHRIFHDEGYQVEVASDGRAGVDSFISLQPSAVVLDLILPQLSGREVCKRIKSSSPDTPVLILSAVSEVVDKVLLLELARRTMLPSPSVPASCWRGYRLPFAADANRTRSPPIGLEIAKSISSK
jgi:DNA-binding response OmpR family regulator